MLGDEVPSVGGLERSSREGRISVPYDAVPVPVIVAGGHTENRHPSGPPRIRAPRSELRGSTIGTRSHVADVSAARTVCRRCSLVRCGAELGGPLGLTRWSRSKQSVDDGSKHY
jgi:hypothetical protein